MDKNHNSDNKRGHFVYFGPISDIVEYGKHNTQLIGEAIS
jgi:hypothetical protein